MNAMMMLSFGLLLCLSIRQVGKLFFKRAVWLSAFLLSVGFLPTAHAVSYEPLTGIAKIATGMRFSCAITNSGGVKCWGKNTNGQLGNGTNIDSTTPVDVVGLSSGVTAISVGREYACVVVNGGVKCWGRTQFGRLGDGFDLDRNTPVDVVGLSSGVIEVGASDMQTCALTSAGAVKCWGDNSYGQFGNGTQVHSWTPVNSSLISGVIGIAVGEAHTCALMNTGGVKCWGGNYYKQLGNNGTAAAFSPVDVYNLTSGVTAISSELTSTCAKTSTGGVKCWGYNGYGQLGNGNTTSSAVPVDVTGLSGVSSLEVGYPHNCVITTLGAAKCWGGNGSGEIGNGASSSYPHVLNPVDVVGLNSGVTAISAGLGHSCAVIAGGVKCWGLNDFGQVGNGTAGDNVLTPTDVVIPLPGYDLTVTNTSTSGSVTSDTGGINCGSTCTATYATNTQVTLTATPPTSNYITVWSGACSSGTNTCTLTMDSAKSVSVKFVLGYPASVSAPTNGKITGLYINCGLGQRVCNANYRSLSTVKFTATPKTGYTFSGWTGDCASSSTNTCTLTVGQAQNLSATFAAPVTYGLSVTKTGSGIVSGLSLNCGTTCSGNYKNGTVVTLTAKPALGSAFTGWSGACSGTASTCSVTVNAAKSVTATFN